MFHGYWENQDLIRLQPAGERLLASFYERAGKLMVILANLTDQDETMKLTYLNGLPVKPERYTDVMTGEAVEAVNQELTLKVAARSFRLLRN